MHGKTASILRGIYFIRFPLLLWIVLAGLGPLDYFTGAASFTRGILTPESAPQASTASFMIVSAGMVILMLIRIIAVNGDERFDVAWRDADGKLMPIDMSWLRRHLGQPDLSLKVFLAAHAAGAVLLGFVGRNILYEIADHDQIVKLFVHAGVLAENGPDHTLGHRGCGNPPIQGWDGDSEVTGHIARRYSAREKLLG